MRKKTVIFLTLFLLLLAAVIAGVLVFLKSRRPEFSGGLKLNEKMPAYTGSELEQMDGLSAAFSRHVNVTLLSDTRLGKDSGKAEVLIETPDIQKLIPECASLIAASDADYEVLLQNLKAEIENRLAAGDYEVRTASIELDTVLTDGVWELQYNEAWYDAIEGGMISLLSENTQNPGGTP